jgi:hypothetical protein
VRFSCTEPMNFLAAPTITADEAIFVWHDMSLARR